MNMPDNALSEEEITQTAERGNWLIWAPTVLGATIVALRERPDPIELIKTHIPSLSDADEAMINALAWGADAADLAQRTCACGAAIAGYYAYVDHLIAVFGGETHYGG